ncbi:hypothetical protein SDC9_163974 [bioreactor metagenome]|uniref:Uncharacterized protein n=1 Tax=bioreactor metagenome TaxID=1076179 RepID=A0A645FT55_9ZZZZ
MLLKLTVVASDTWIFVTDTVGVSSSPDDPPPDEVGVCVPEPVELLLTVEPPVISVPPPPVTPVTPVPTVIWVFGVSTFVLFAPDCASTFVTVPEPLIWVFSPDVVTVPTEEPLLTTMFVFAPLTLTVPMVAPLVVSVIPGAATSILPTVPSTITSSEPSST